MTRNDKCHSYRFSTGHFQRRPTVDRKSGVRRDRVQDEYLRSTAVGHAGVAPELCEVVACSMRAQAIFCQRY